MVIVGPLAATHTYTQKRAQAIKGMGCRTAQRLFGAAGWLTGLASGLRGGLGWNFSNELLAGKGRGQRMGAVSHVSTSNYQIVTGRHTGEICIGHGVTCQHIQLSNHYQQAQGEMKTGMVLHNSATGRQPEQCTVREGRGDDLGHADVGKQHELLHEPVGVLQGMCAGGTVW